MLKRFTIIIVAFFLLQTTAAFAGVMWKTTIVTKGKAEESTTIMQGYAQKGNVREDFVEVPKGKNAMAEKGTYYLYHGDSSMVYLVNPKDKNYMVFSVDSLMQFASSASQFMNLKITNLTTAVKELNPETVATYSCKHIMINSSYDMEMKIVFIKSKSHIDQSKELWATNAIPLQDMAGSYIAKSFKTGVKDLDALIQKETAAYENLGFVIKSITTQKTTQGKKTETSVTETTVSDIIEKNLSTDLFKIPADYERIDLSKESPPPEE